MLFQHHNYHFFRGKTSDFWFFFIQAILSEPSWILIILYILPECKSKKIKIAILELKNPYVQIFVRHPVYIFKKLIWRLFFLTMFFQNIFICLKMKTYPFNLYLGQFKVKWIYVKDVPNQQLRHIKLENNENKPVTNSRDTQVSREQWK